MSIHGNYKETLKANKKRTWRKFVNSLFFSGYKGKHHYHIGLHFKEIQGFGFMVSFDNPSIGGENYILVSFKFAWFIAWYMRITTSS
jgi:hypothetical protein